MNKRIGYKDLYNMYKKAGILDDIKAGAGKAFDAVGKEWNKNPYLRTGVGALTGAGLGGLVGGKTGAGIGALLGGTGGYLAHGDQEAAQEQPGLYNTGNALVLGGALPVGAVTAAALLRMNPKTARVLKKLVGKRGIKAVRGFDKALSEGADAVQRAFGRVGEAGADAIGGAKDKISRGIWAAKLDAGNAVKGAKGRITKAISALRGQQELPQVNRVYGYKRRGKPQPKRTNTVSGNGY